MFLFATASALALDLDLDLDFAWFWILDFGFWIFCICHSIPIDFSDRRRAPDRRLYDVSDALRLFVAWQDKNNIMSRSPLANNISATISYQPLPRTPSQQMMMGTMTIGA